VAIPERISNGHSAPPRLPDGPVAPPQNLEAEQSVLGAVLLSDTALPALIIDERLHPEDFYREAHGLVFAAMLELHNGGEPVDALTLVEHLKQAGKLEQAGGRSAIELLASSVPAVGHVRQYARIVRENAMLRRLLRASYEIQARVHSHDAPPRDLVDIAERTILEVAHEDSRKDFRAINDVLDVEITKLEQLSQEGKSITGTPSGFDDLDNITGGFQPGNLIILAARPSMGKCLAGSTLIYDPRDGRRRRLDELVTAHETGEEIVVVSANQRHKLHRSRVSAAIRSGIQPVFRLTTKLGRQIDATASHPLLTIEGWKKLGDLRPGDRIAAARSLPWPHQRKLLPDHELVLLAALIAAGNVTGSSPRFAFGQGSPMVATVARAAEEIGVRLNVPAAGHGMATLSNGRGGGPNPVTELCRRHGLWGKGSRDKHVPDAIFTLGPEQIARFLGVLYGCDGHGYVSDRLCQIGYTTISERLARDVQHLLLRLNCVAKIRHLKRAVYVGTNTIAREVLVTGQADLDAFAAKVPVVGKQPQLRRVFEHLAAHRFKTYVDTLPVEAWTQVSAVKGERKWASVGERAGHPRNNNWHVGTRGLSRPQLARLASALEDAPLGDRAASDFWWDAVASIEALGERETYDLTVPGDHNFVANDLIVHNSALMANFAENAALGGKHAVALFSLEMSESELAQRFIASQASIKGDDLRKGRVPAARWGKIMEASNRLAKSPLFIDDSSDLSVLDVRAKARRLMQQHPDGLGLILIDYLQLMRGDGRTDNRVEQIGQISRGLKTLARELDCPVIALSQLNRGVEQRTDKRPVLSDLRESGSIEQDADLVMFIYRDEYYDKESEREGIADLIISKHRNGGLGDVELTFQKEYPRFMSYVGDDRYQ
jgi:replicative DNA helicase